MSAHDTLADMGFPADKIERAINACGENAEQAMEWLLAHADEPSISSQPINVSVGAVQEIKDEDSEMTEVLEADGNEGALEDTVKPSENSENDVKSAMEACENTDGDCSKIAKSFKCDECQKLFKTQGEVEFHAHKSGHASFSESTEEKKALTEDEKKQKLKDLEDKMKLRRKQMEEEERKEAIEREKKRIQMSKNITDTKREMAEKEMKLIAEQRRKEKLEDKLARQKVKDQIERDKIARKEMFGGGAVKSATADSQCPPVVSTPQVTVQKKEYESTRLQIRLPSGPPLVQEFKVKESLSAVHLWVRLNRKDGPMDADSFTLSTTFPRKTFSDEDMDKPLNILQLVPSAVLVVTDS